jgi:hypothetical protein
MAGAKSFSPATTVSDFSLDHYITCCIVGKMSNIQLGDGLKIR